MLHLLWYNKIIIKVYFLFQNYVLSEILEKKFGAPTPYEIPFNKTNKNNNKNRNNKINMNNLNRNNNNDYVKRSDFNKLKNNFEDILKVYKLLENEFKGIINERNKMKEYLREEITKIMKEIKDMDYKIKNSTYKRKELQNYMFYKNSFKITLVLLILVII